MCDEGRILIDECDDDSSPPIAINHGDDICDVTSSDATVLPSLSVADNAGTSWPVAVFLIVNAALGAGLLNFPQAYDRAGGVFVSLCVQLALLVPIIASLLVLAACAERGDGSQCSATYQATVSALLGRVGRLSCSLAIAVYCFGTCITFLIIIRDQADVVMSWIAGRSYCDHWYMNGSFTMPAASVLIILPLCFSRRIDFLKYSSMVGVLAIFYLDALIVYQYFYGHFTAGPIKHSPDTWTDVFLVMPTICFGYQCHVSAVPIYSCLKQRSLSSFRYCVLLALLVCVLTYSVAGTVGYWTFGGLVDADVLVSYGVGRPSVLVGVIALAVKTATTYPLLLFCGREAIDTLWSAAALAGHCWFPSELVRRVIVASAWFCCSVVLAAVAPDISAVISLLGSLAAVFIFVYPGLCLFSWQIGLTDNDSNTRRNWLLVLAVVLVSVGVFVFGVVLTQVVLQNMSAVVKSSPFSSVELSIADKICL